MSLKEEPLHVVPVAMPVGKASTPVLSDSPLRTTGGMGGLLGRGGIGYTRALVHKPNTLHFTRSQTCYAVLQSMHRMAVGDAAHAIVRITGISDAKGAKDVYLKTRAAAVAFCVGSKRPQRRTLFRELLTFATANKSFDGLEGLFLTGLRAQEEEGNTALVHQGVQTWKSLGLGKTRDAGASGSVFLDLGTATLLMVNGKDLAALGTDWKGTGSTVFGVLKLPVPLGAPGSSLHASVRPAVAGPSAGSGAVLPGRPGVPGGLGGPGGAGGVVTQTAKDAGKGFLTEIFGDQTAKEIGIAVEIIGKDTAAGAAAGSLFGGVGSTICSIAGFIYGLFQAAEAIDEEEGQQKVSDLGKQFDDLEDQLDAMTSEIDQAADEVKKEYPEQSNSKDDDDDSKDDTPETPQTGDDPNDGKTDTPSDPPEGTGTSAIGDAGDDNGDDTGGGANNVDINTHWPALVPIGGGGTGDPGDGGDPTGKPVPVPTGNKGGGHPAYPIIDGGLGDDTGLHELPPIKIIGGGTGDHTGDQDNLGKVHPIPTPGSLLNTTGMGTIKRFSLTHLGGGAVQVTRRQA